MSFADILKTNVDDIEKPPLAPIGLYAFVVTKYEFTEFPKKDGTGNWEAIDFHLKAQAAIEVDEDALAEFGSVDRIAMRKRFMTDPSDPAAVKTTQWNLKSFLSETLGIEAEGVSLNEMVAASVNRPLQGYIKWTPDSRAERQGEFFAELGNTAKLD